MRRKILTGLCFVYVVLVMAGISFSAIPKKISFQGRLLTSAGSAVSDGNYSITFKIYDASSGGAALWSETQTVATTSGYYNVVLGSTTAITLAFDKDYWISVQVGTDLEMSPRFYLGVAGYCVNADTVDGNDSTAFSLTSHNHDSSYVNEAQTNSITSTMITDITITDADIDTTKVQKRVTGTCAGQVVTAINADGTVTCETDDTGSGGSPWVKIGDFSSGYTGSYTVTIPSGYNAIRIFLRFTTYLPGEEVLVRFNGDSSANYRFSGVRNGTFYQGSGTGIPVARFYGGSEMGQSEILIGGNKSVTFNASQNSLSSSGSAHLVGGGTWGGSSQITSVTFVNDIDPGGHGITITLSVWGSSSIGW